MAVTKTSRVAASQTATKTVAASGNAIRKPIAKKVATAPAKTGVKKAPVKAAAPTKTVAKKAVAAPTAAAKVALRNFVVTMETGSKETDAAELVIVRAESSAKARSEATTWIKANEDLKGMKIVSIIESSVISQKRAK